MYLFISIIIIVIGGLIAFTALKVGKNKPQLKTVLVIFGMLLALIGIVATVLLLTGKLELPLK